MEKVLTYSKKPTILQTRTMQIMVANGGKMSLSKAMRQAGYSEAMARNSQKLARSKTFKDFLEEVGLSDNVIAKKYVELLSANSIERLVLGWSRIGRKYVTISQNDIKNKFNINNLRILYITEDNTKKESVVYYANSDYRTQMCIIDLISKIKGYYNNQSTNTLNHELTAHEKKTLVRLIS